MCVEHPFGSIKQWMRRRLESVPGDSNLIALAYTMRRAINL